MQMIFQATTTKHSHINIQAMTKSKWGQVLREITDPHANNLVNESERPHVESGIDSDYFINLLDEHKEAQ